MIRIYQRLLLAAASFLLMGTSCHFGADVAVYDLKDCPQEGFAWPGAFKSEKLEISQESLKYSNPDRPDSSGNSYECRKLRRYHVKEKINKKSGLSKIEWAEHDLYIGLLKNPKCSLAVAFPGPGPQTSETDKVKNLNNWINQNKDILGPLFSNSSIKIIEPPVQVSWVDGKDDYKKWCDNLATETAP